MTPSSDIEPCTYVKLPKGRSFSDVYIGDMYRPAIYLNFECSAWRVNEDGELEPVAFCDVCQDDTFRCADGSCSPCESRESYTRVEADESVTLMERRPSDAA